MTRLSILLLAMLAAGCHHQDPYPWPRPGEPSAAPLESQLSQRDSLQDAANDVIAVAAAIRDAVAKVYPAAQWATTSQGGQAGCEPPFEMLPTLDDIEHANGAQEPDKPDTPDGAPK